MGIVWVLLAIVAGLFGAQYLQVSSQTNSAIHEIAGVLGLGLAALLVGQGYIMGQNGTIQNRLRALGEKAEDAQIDVFLSKANERHRAAAIALKGVLLSGQSNQWKGSLEIARYLRRAEAAEEFTNYKLKAVQAWIDGLPFDGPDLREAVAALPALSLHQRGLLETAIEEIAKTAKKSAMERQRRLIDAIGEVLEAGGDAAQPA